MQRQTHLHASVHRTRSVFILLLVMLIAPAGCVAPQANMTLPAPSAFATPTVVPITATSIPSPTPRAPTAVAGSAPVAPSATAAPPSATPAPPGFDTSAQAAALLPDFAADLAQADAWDRYRIEAVLDPAALTVSGNQRVDVRNRTGVPLDTIYFHLYPNHPDFGGSLTVDDVQVNGQPAQVGTEQGDTLLRIALAQPLAPDAQVTVSMRFTARTQRNASARAYGAFNQEAGVWALASFYPTLARYFAGSGWDRRPISSRGDLVVTETALYDVTLVTPAEWTLAGTGVRVDAGTAPAARGQRRERFVSGPQRDFFLTALKGLDQASATVDGTRIVSYYQAGNAAAGRRSLAVAEASLRAFNARYGRYPLGELEIVQAALTNFLGVEYPGVVLIEQNLYRQNSRGLETTVAHEVAHQWWYSLVGNDYQGEPWLDEGLASFSQIIYYEERGDGGAAAAELQSFRDQYRAARNAGRDAPVNQPVSAFNRNYVALAYAKSALFFQALRVRLGDETFFRFMRRYYETYRYHEATGPGLLATAEATCNCELDQFYNAWINSAAAVDIP